MKYRAVLCAAALVVLCAGCRGPQAKPAQAAGGEPVLRALTVQDESGIRASLQGGAEQPLSGAPLESEFLYFISQRSPLSQIEQGESWEELAGSVLSAGYMPLLEEALSAPLPQSPGEERENEAAGTQGVWAKAVFDATLLQGDALEETTLVAVLFRPQGFSEDLWMFWALAPGAQRAPSKTSLGHWQTEQLKGYGEWFEKEAGLFFSFNAM